MKRIALAALAAWMGAGLPGQAFSAEEDAVVRGGRLYDHWSRELKDHPPRLPHPAFAAKASGVAAADTWRCKECHGFDYKGNHGMVGIRNSAGGDPAAIVAILKDATHGYGALMGDGDLKDIARFVSQGQVDMDKLVGSVPRTKAASYEKHYATMCAACHGLDGGRLREIRMLGELARQRPKEILHVILNGHPGAGMPALRALGPDLSAGVLAYLQTLPSQNLAASIAHGGRLYDNWAKETRAQGQPLPHPAYPQNAYFAGNAPTTWRCKECHGWDYLGARGSYGSGRHATGIKGIEGMAGAEPARVLGVLRDGNHRYDAVLKERDLQDLANFVSAGQVDMDAAIERSSRRARGVAERGGPYYRTICVACHGRDGQLIHTTLPLGRVARENPWESLHKIVNGHPDEKMPALRELPLQVQIDILAYLQGLPETR